MSWSLCQPFPRSRAAGGDGSDGGSDNGNSGDGNDDSASVSRTWKDTFTPARKIDQSRKLAYIGGDAGIYLSGERLTTVGNVAYANGYTDMLVTRYTQQGQRLGFNVFSSEGTLTTYCANACADQPTNESQIDRAYSHAKDAAMTPDGGAVVVGTSSAPDKVADQNTNSWFVVKYGPNGQKRWQRMWRRCNTLVPCDAQAFAVSVDANGNIFVSGHGWNTGGTQKFQLEALNASGETLWKDRRDFSQTDTDYDLLTRSEQGGHYLYATEPKQNYVHKYQVADGSHLWDKELGQRIGRIATAPDGENLLLISANGAHVYKVDPADGSTVWHVENADATDFKALEVADDHIYVAADQGEDVRVYDIADSGDSGASTGRPATTPS